MDAQTAPQQLVVDSSVLKPGQPFPKDYTADGRNVSPPLAWKGAPAATKEFALIMDDPDAPTPQPFVHWVLYKIPAGASELPEGVPAGASLTGPAALAGAQQGVGGFRRGEPGYRGPAPPPGKVHHYHFTVYALDAPLDPKPGLDKAGLLEAMKGHIIGQGELIATYERKGSGLE
jgi:Raf kinase inhibitor-like YbhB/YbcL family protein